MLSGPPRSFASDTSPSQARRGALLSAILRISCDFTWRVRPSVQSTSMSPLRSGSGPCSLDRDVLGETQRPQDDVGARVMLGLGRAEHTLAHQLGDERMVLGQLTDLAAPDEEGPTVAHVGQEGVVFADDQRGERRPHRLLARGDPALAIHDLVRDLDGRAQRLRQRLRALGVVVGVVQRLDREATGHVSARVAAHPVRDDEETPARPEKLRVVRLEGAEEVFVSRANPTDVRDVSERDGRRPTGVRHHSALRLVNLASLASTALMSVRTGGGA